MIIVKARIPKVGRFPTDVLHTDALITVGVLMTSCVGAAVPDMSVKASRAQDHAPQQHEYADKSFALRWIAGGCLTHVACHVAHVILSLLWV